ncbi:hypothetical protein AMAG_12169 [Allomyces macrogynus ATCC 38327]|uniref:Uncharacterized protein n=1 Tax=Allomyces macrogynus (strain ATCC 38327) TaxID=578462 RepID=A0A0L0SX66_ALLM3|nr:hypothetical protein AMAG_12169 [Allomyces macrogynus ATCC 38327]|eukprot:KNE67092.1 hypothetical protein AMAG_12169 [Allomyces macrogynus ATCC 38327]
MLQSPWLFFLVTKTAFLPSDSVKLKRLRTAPGFPFLCIMDVAHQFLIMAIEHNNAELLDELLAQHRPRQFDA